MFNFVEEFPSARPSHVLKLGGVSALLVLSAIAGYILLNPMPVEPTGEVTDVRLYSAQPPSAAANTTPDAGVVLASYTQPGRTLLVLTPVKIHNTSDKPYSIFDMNGVVRLGNAEYHSADVSPEDFAKVFRYYPDLAAYQQPPLQRHAVIQPGETLAGLMVFAYPMTEEQWGQRASFEVKVSFDHGRDIVLSGTDTQLNESQLTAEPQ
jgi:hypothetical protein